MSDTTLTLTIISSAVALGSAGLAVWGQFRLAGVNAGLAKLKAEADARRQREETVSRYREPLGLAAFDLASRLYNILEGNFIERYLTRGSAASRFYAAENTLFLIAQYFAWREIIRRDIQFLDTGEDSSNRKLRERLDAVRSVWRRDRYDDLFRIFTGDQRAIGERLIHESPTGSVCIGYAGFVDNRCSAKDPTLDALRADLLSLETRIDGARIRLTMVQHKLADLLNLLDPDHLRFPERERDKVTAPPGMSTD